jgi:hypothetical protein
MESLILEFPHKEVPAWLEEMADEFTEDPFCHMVMVGADSDSVLFMSLWESSMASEVEASMRSMMLPSGTVRRLIVSVPEVSTGS